MAVCQGEQERCAWRCGGMREYKRDECSTKFVSFQEELR